MSNKAKTPLLPKLRFPAFKGAGGWTTKKLGSLVSISTEKVGDKTCVPMSITSGVGLVSQEDKFGRVIAGSSYKSYLLLKPSDFAYNKSATKEYPEGFLALYSGDKLAAVPNSIFTCFRTKGESTTQQYLNYLFLGNLHGRWLRKVVQVGARAHGTLSISDSDLLALPIPLPKGKSSVAEQQQIAACLSALDELISAEASQLEVLKTHKQGLMQQLFPREGEAQPRLRFPIFRDKGKWQKRTISDLLTKLVRPVAVDLDATYSEIGIRSHGKGVFHKEPTSGKAIGEKRVFWLTAEALVLNIVFAWEQAVAVTSSAENGMIASHRFPMYLAKSPKTDIHFIKYFFLSEKGRELLGIASPGGAGRNRTLGQKDFEKLELLLPSAVSEQKKISKTLSSLDTLIVIQRQSLESLKTHKKGLMQQLFPSAEAGKA